MIQIKNLGEKLIHTAGKVAFACFKRLPGVGLGLDIGEIMYDMAHEIYKGNLECPYEKRLEQIQEAGELSVDRTREILKEVQEENLQGESEEIWKKSEMVFQTLLRFPQEIQRKTRYLIGEATKRGTTQKLWQSPEDFVRLIPLRPGKFQEGSAVEGTDYNFHQYLGSGAFGETWALKETTYTNKTVVGKFCLHEQSKKSLEREAQLLGRLSQLQNPYIIRFEAPHLRSQIPWLEFEYWAGATLYEWAQSRGVKISWEEWIPMLRQIVQGLQCAHDHNIVHRDVKPENILINDQSAIKILDFGIGKLIAETKNIQTQHTFMTAGTPLYMSPEQEISREAHVLDDVYSVGIITYQLLLGDLNKRVSTDYAEELADYHISQKAIQFISGCLKRRERRATTRQLLEMIGLAKDSPGSSREEKIKVDTQDAPCSSRLPELSGLDSQDADFYYNRGISHYSAQRYEKAIEDYTKAISIVPKYINAYYNRGIVYNILEKYDKALKDYTKVIELDPSYTNAWYNRGHVYYHCRNYDKAVEDFTNAVSIDPKYINAYYNRGLAHDFLGEYDAALWDYAKALELDPKYTNAYYNIGLVYYHMQDYTRAIEYYTKAIAISPKYVNAYYNRALCYDALQNYDKSIADYTKAVEIDPQYTNAYYNCGLAYYNLRQYNKAIDKYNRAIALDPKYTNAYYNRGLAHYYLHQDNDAIEDYSKTIDIDPKYTNAYYNRGLAYECLQKYNMAIEDFTRAIDLNPGKPIFYERRANVYEKIGNYSEAKKDREKVESL